MTIARIPQASVAGTGHIGVVNTVKNTQNNIDNSYSIY